MLYDPKWEVTAPIIPAPLEPWRKLLLDAADALETRGHVKGVLCDGGRVCVRGALNVAVHGNYTFPAVYPPSYNEAEQVIADHLGFHNIYDVVEWNNAPERTQAEVVGALRACAAQGAKP